MDVRELRLLDMLGTVREKGYTTTQELAEKFGVSVSTVRRDLAEPVSYTHLRAHET